MAEYPFKDLLPLDEVLEREGYYRDWTHLDPEVFYSLTQISEYVKTKGYGVDVRLLIAQLAEHFGLRVTQITDAMNEFNDLKPKAELSVSQSAEALTKSQSALNVANSADTLSKSVQEQFNQVVIDGDSSVEAAQARVDASGQTNPTLKARLDKEHNEVTAQLVQKANQAFVDSQLSTIVSGAPKGTYTDLTALQTAYPNGAEGIFLVLENGHWYYWHTDTSVWSDGGVYQSTGLGDGDVKPENTNFMSYNNIFTPENITEGKFLQANGVVIDHALYDITGFEDVLPNTTYLTNSHRLSVFYDGAKKPIGHLDSVSNVTGVETAITTPANTRFIRTNILKTMRSKYRLYPKERKYLLTSEVVLDVKNSDLEILQDKNLAIKDNASVGKFLANDGTLSDIPAYTTSDYIELIPGEYDFNVHRRTVFYDENKIIVSYLDSGSILRGKIPITVPNGVKFARTTIPTEDWDNFTIFSRSYQTLEFTDAVNLPKTEIVTESKWEGKSAINFGTSISWQDGKAYTQSADIGKIAKGWQSHVRENTGITIQNEGVSGSRLIGASGTRVLAETFDFSPYDVVFFEIATNDFRLDTPLGTLGIMGDTAFETGTFYGGYRHLIEYVLTSNPEIKIVLFTPLQRDNSGYDVNTVNGAGHKLYDYVQAIREIGEMYSLQVIDLYKESGFNKFTLDTFTMDGLHPNDLGYVRMGETVSDYLK